MAEKHLATILLLSQKLTTREPSSLGRSMGLLQRRLLRDASLQKFPNSQALKKIFQKTRTLIIAHRL